MDENFVEFNQFLCLQKNSAHLNDIVIESEKTIDYEMVKSNAKFKFDSIVAIEPGGVIFAHKLKEKFKISESNFATIGIDEIISNYYFDKKLKHLKNKNVLIVNDFYFNDK